MSHPYTVETRPDGASWFAYTTVNGNRRKKSTGIPKTEPEEKALKVAKAIYDARVLKEAGGLTPERLTHIVNTTVLIAEGVKSIPSFAKLSEEFLEEKKLHVAESTLKICEISHKLFTRFLGAKADQPITKITEEDVKAWRSEMMKNGLKSSTIKNYFIKVNALFGEKKVRMYVPISPFEEVKVGNLGDEEEKKPIFREELKEVLTYITHPDWETIYRFAYYHGLRSGDCCMMKWSYLDLDKGKMNLKPRKQRKSRVIKHVLKVPLHPDMLEHLKTLKREGEFVCPHNAALYQRATNNPANMSAKNFRMANIEGSMHGIRHGFITTLAEAGVPSDVRKALAGHKDTDVHSRYTHHSDKVLLDALKNIPTL